MIRICEFLKLFKQFIFLGGGLVENIPRVLPPEISCKLNANLWPIPPVFGWLSKMGGLSTNEMLRTFNCGLGGVLIVAKKYEEVVLENLKEAGESAFLVGTLFNKENIQVQVEGSVF